MNELTDTGRIEMLLEQLVRLTGDQANPGLAAAGSPIGSTDMLPIQRRMVQTAPQYFDNPVSNLAYNTVAPMLASHISGGRATQLLPQFSNSVGSYESFYGRDITTPLYDAGKQIMMQDYGAGFGVSAAQMAGRVGLRPKGMSQDEFEGKMADLGATSGGQMLAGALMSTRPMQELMGGNPMDIYNAMFPRMQQLATPTGMLVDPMDTVAQSGMAENATRYTQALDRAIFMDQETGKRGYIPNAAFTRGHSMSDIAKVSAVMTDRNYAYDMPTPDGGLERVSMRGLDTSPDTKVKMLGDQLAVLDTIGQVIQDADIDNKIKALDAFTQGRAHQIDPEVLRGALDNIAATAENLGVSSKSMMTGILQTQAALGGISGGSQLANGAYIGAGAGPQHAQYMETQAQVIAHQTGRSVEDVRGEQMALYQVGEQSGQGQAMRLIEFMRQQGDPAVSEALYAQLEEAMKTGDTGNRAGIMNQIFERSQFGSTAGAMAKMADPAFQRELQNRSSEAAWLKGTQMIQMGQDTELLQRTRETELNLGERMAKRMFASSNQDYSEVVNSGGNAERQLQAMQAGLKDMGDDVSAQRLADQFKRAGGGAEGLRAVRSLIQSDPGLKEKSKGLNALAQQERLKISDETLASGKGRDAAELSSRMKYLRITAAGDKTDERRRALDEAATALREGDTSAAKRMIAKQERTLTRAERQGLELHMDREFGRDNSRLAQLRADAEGGGGPESGRTGLTHALTATQYGISGIGHAIADRATSAEAFGEVTARAEAGARMRRDMGDIWAAKRETPMQRMVKWAEGRGSVYDVLGVQAPDDSELAGMTPEQVAKLSDKDIAKMDEASKASATQMRDYLASAEGKLMLKQVDDVAKMTDVQGQLAGTKWADNTAGLAAMSDEEFAGLSRKERKQLKAPREYLRARAESLERSTPEQLQEQLSARQELTGLAGADTATLGEMPHGKQEQRVDAKELKEHKPEQQGPTSTRLTGTVVLRREGGGTMGTLDFENARLDE